ncbi:MAG: ABC-2 transporter permease [Lachnospiraceae bacterium]
MIGLIRKDIYLNWKSFIMSMGAVVFLAALYLLPVYEFEAIDSMMSMVLLFCTFAIFILSGSNITGSIASDEDELTGNFIASAPVGTKGMIRVKYIEEIALSVFAMALCMLLVWANSFIAGRMVVQYSMVFIIFLVYTMMNAVVMPFYFAFGTRYGNIYKVGIVGILMAIIIIYALYGDISPDGWAVGMLKGGLTFFMDSAKNMVTFLLGFGAIAALVYVISYEISVLAKRRK